MSTPQERSPGNVGSFTDDINMVIDLTQLLDFADRCNYAESICTLVAEALTDSASVGDEYPTALRGAAAMLDGLARAINNAGEKLTPELAQRFIAAQVENVTPLPTANRVVRRKSKGRS
jgi:hypothetical protein